MGIKENKYLVHILTLSCLSLISVNLNALSLEESIYEVINTNPVVTERVENYRATQQDLKISESEYLPSIDLRSEIGVKSAGNIYDRVRDVNYHYYENSLKLTQNLFNGFDTTHKVGYQEARVLSAAYHYLEKANDISYKMTEAYLNVLKNYKLLQNAQENVEFHQQMYEDIQNLYDAGLDTASSISKVKASLALAKTNYIVQKNNTKDAEFNFARVLGRKPIVTDMQMPTLDIKMPDSIQRATMYAMKNNPSLLVSHYNIQGAQSLFNKAKSGNYPRLDFEIEQLLNDAHTRNNGFDVPDDRFRVGLVLNWNLYGGGSDEAAKQKAIVNVHQELQIQRDLQRQVIEGVELSWSAYENIQEQVAQLEEYNKYSESTLISYKEEYKLGKRSLLDFIVAENDVINSRAQMIKAEHEQIFAQYRLLDAMGLLVKAVSKDSDYEHIVNINTDEVTYVTKTLPFKFDSDNDNLTDNIDTSSNSSLADRNQTMPYGASRGIVDPNKDITLRILKLNNILKGGN